MLGLTFMNNGGVIMFNYNDGCSISWPPGGNSSSAQIMKGWQKTAADAAHLDCIVLGLQSNSSQSISLPISPTGIVVPIAMYPCTIRQLIDAIYARNGVQVSVTDYETTTGTTWKGTGTPTVKDVLKNFQGFTQLYPDNQNNYWLG